MKSELDTLIDATIGDSGPRWYIRAKRILIGEKRRVEEGERGPDRWPNYRDLCKDLELLEGWRNLCESSPSPPLPSNSSTS